MPHICWDSCRLYVVCKRGPICPLALVCAVQGLLAFRAISYTPWPVPTDYDGDRIRIPVGPIRDRKPRCALTLLCEDCRLGLAADETPASWP